MRISDWSSDVCSSDLFAACKVGHIGPPVHGTGKGLRRGGMRYFLPDAGVFDQTRAPASVDAFLGHRPGDRRACLDAIEIGDQRLGQDRKSVGSGKSVSVRVDLGGRRMIKKKKRKKDK